jgi:tetratricopeptide (TPR) repeat protein
MRYNILFVFYLLILGCGSDRPDKAMLGVANLPVEGKVEAQEWFNKGLLLLHSFEYEDARSAFREAQKIEPGMLMAYWGESMTFNHPIWHRQEPDSGRMALDKAIKAGAKPANELEREFIESLNILYEEGLAKEYRDQEYMKFMSELAIEYPQNHEVLSFYALSLLGSVPDGRDVEVYGNAGEIAAKVVSENRNHPGALHYLIHAYDDPDHAHLAMDAANSYALVAPDASHALHMPSHIFVAKGMWDEVVSSNIASFNASVTRMEQQGLGDDARGYHSYHWLQYGYLQKGLFEMAATMVDSMNHWVSRTPSRRGRSHLIYLLSTYLVESDDWDGEFRDLRVDASDLNIRVRAKQYYLDGFKAYRADNVETLDSLIAVLETEVRRELLYADTSDFKLCIPNDRSEAQPSDIGIAKTMLLELSALSAMLKGDNENADVFLAQATELEDSINYSFGPPSIVKPSHELYGEWLESQGRIEEALREFEKALTRAPGRRISSAHVANLRQSQSAVAQSF